LQNILEKSSLLRGVELEKLRKEKIAFTVIKVISFSSVVFLLTLLGYIFYKGFKVINWQFLFDLPRNGFTEGGIFPSIIGTVYLIIGTMIFAVPIGILAGVYLAEYAKENKFTDLLRISINVLAGVPSIVFGLFGLAIFVKRMHLGVSIISGSLTLGVLVLPTIIQATIEAIKNVPDSFREASYGVGATKWQTVYHISLKTAISGIFTGIIISIGRAAGEAAPILFTAATFYTRGLPASVFDKVMALPYIIYGLITEGTFPDKQVPIAYGASVILLIIVLLFSTAGIIIMIRIRRKKLW
jgi:phosphate transport system permease protein